jgi:hypothetical protein
MCVSGLTLLCNYMCLYTRRVLALSTMTKPTKVHSRSHIHLRLHIRLQRFGSIDPHPSHLRHFKFDWSSLREQQRVAQLESVGGAEACPALREGAKRLLPKSVGGTLHHPWRQRASENVPGSIAPLQSVFAPVRSWDILRPPQSKTHGLIPQSTIRIDLLSGIELHVQEIPEN